MVMGAPTQDDVIWCEGNLFFISVALRKGRVVDAWSTGRMLHNMEYLLGASIAGDESFFVQRPHCLCNAGHALAATRALEQLVGIRLPEAARLVRNIVHGLQFLLDHLTNFYVFYANDWLSPGAALRATPAKTAAFAGEANPCLRAGARFYAAAQERLAAQAASEGGGWFPGRDGEEPGYAVSPEASLCILSHVPAALAIRAKLAQAQKILQGSLAAVATWHVGGLPKSAGLAPGDNPDLSPAARAACAALVGECRRFIEDVFWPDVLHVGRAYREWAAIGRTDVLLSWGEFPGPGGGEPLFPGGVFRLGEAVAVRPAGLSALAVDQDPDWAAPDRARYRLRFGPGEPAYRWRGEAFRWFSAPRLDGQACEVGPLARVVGAYGQGNALVRSLADAALAALDLPLAALNSTLGRVLARGLEAVACIRAAGDWLRDLDVCLDRDDAALRVDWELPGAGEGVGLAELGRGALAHRLRLRDGRIVEHRALVPSLWNFSPRGGDGSPGPLERALRSAPVADPARPVELLRIIHTFDPCNACVLRVEDGDTGRVSRTNAK